MNRLSPLMTRIVIGVVVAAVVVVGAVYLFSGGSNNIVTAEFSEAVGVYPGTPVKVMGVTVGDVTKVSPSGDHVTITMEYGSQYKLVSNAIAVTVANSLVSDRYLQIGPLWTGTGGVLPNHGNIPANRTQGPSELDDIYDALSKFAVALGPQGANKTGALSNLVNVGAANLSGNGAALGQSITNLSAAAKTLADGRFDLFGTVKNLQVFTKALQGSDTQIRLVEQQLAQVAGDLASERGDLGTALHTLAGALDEVANFVHSNQATTHTDLAGLANIAGILVKEQASLNETLAVGPVALANVVHVYQPDLGVLPARSNLASLSQLGSLCTYLNTKYLSGILGPVSSTLNQILGSLKSKGLSTGVLGVDTTGIVSACDTVFSDLAKSGTSSSTSSSSAANPSALNQLLGGGLGGLILGG